MTPPIQRAGRRGSWWLLLPLLTLCATGIGHGQEKLKSDETSKFENYRTGNLTIAANDPVLQKAAKYYAGQLTNSDVQKDLKNGMSFTVQEFSRRATTPVTTPYVRLTENQKKFVDEFGKVMMAQLEPLVLNNSKAIVRINALRIAGELARSGSVATADVFVRCLAKPNTGEWTATKHWALIGLGQLFAVVPDPLAPAKTLFQTKNTAELPDNERLTIKAIIDYVTRKWDETEGLSEDEINAIRYVRSEGFKALGHVRVQSVKKLGIVELRPALTLLKAARSDGFFPTTGIRERVEAIIGFCQLLPDRDRDLQLDYAAYHLGHAIADIALYRVQNLTDQNIPWKVTAIRLKEAMILLRDRSEDLKLANAKHIRDLLETASSNVLDPIEVGREGAPPNEPNMRTWVTQQIKLDPKASLFKSDAATTVNVKP